MAVRRDQANDAGAQRGRRGGTPTRTGPEDVADRLHSWAIHLLRWLREADRASPVSAAELSALSVLVHAGPLSLSALAQLEQVQPPSMSRTVRGLEKRDLVDRAPDPRDGRAVRLSATPAGREILEAGRERRLSVLQEQLDELSDEEVERIRNTLDLLDGLLP